MWRTQIPYVAMSVGKGQFDLGLEFLTYFLHKQIHVAQIGHRR
jgi:hypothetical protein